MNMENIVKKTNTQVLKEIQDLVDDINKSKSEVESLLTIIDNLELRYYKLIEEAKENNKK
ncbi:MAG TPA: hypothetical protein VNX68_13490 [Nitrosopumilaceae archaeon]|jgi:hypothetical protein|nr:hypothetical protein [Nitrosopumilaceae archaeon]